MGVSRSFVPGWLFAASPLVRFYLHLSVGYAFGSSVVHFDYKNDKFIKLIAAVCQI
jgi:hypothetical protein